MRVLVACEFSGIVREAFKARGHDAWSCDLLPTEIEGQHIQGDVLEILDDGWDLMIAHPPCTYICSAGFNWINRQPNRMKKAEESLNFIRKLMDAAIFKIAIENPVGMISTKIRKPNQYIQPYFFGDPYQKKTGLWLKNLPPLISSVIADKGEIYITKSGKSRGGKWTMNLPGQGKNTQKIRSRTFPGIAKAMATQWSKDLTK